MMMTYVCLDEKVFENYITIFVINIKHESSNFKFIHVIKIKKFILFLTNEWVSICRESSLGP